LIDWYRARWEIEMFFYVLKNGCKVKALQLASVEKLERALAVYLVVAWRIARLMRPGISRPDRDAELLFEHEKWQTVYLLQKKPVPKKTPRLNEAVRLVTMLGGLLGRKGDGEPRIKTLWQGLQRVADFAQGLQWARESPGGLSCVQCNGLDHLFVNGLRLDLCQSLRERHRQHSAR
jgi:hypothetical protein